MAKIQWVAPETDTRFSDSFKSQKIIFVCTLFGLFLKNNATDFNFKKFIFAQIVNLGTDPHLLAQLVERCTGIAEVMGSNPVRA